MGRLLFHVVAFVSLLACVAVGAAWVDSYWEIVEVRYAARGSERLHVFRSYWGALQWDESDAGSRAASASYFDVKWATVGPEAGAFIRPAFRGFGHDENTGALVVPHWAPFVVTAVLPLLWLRSRLRRRRRARLGMCVDCGYDLRVTRGRCPECGAAGPATRSKAA